MAKQAYRAIGVFFDENYAQRAIQALQAQGINAQLADKSVINDLKRYGFTDEDQIRVYQARFQEGNPVVIADAGQQSDEVMNLLLQYGAENIDLTRGQTARQYQNLQANQRQYGPYDQEMGRARSADEARLVLVRESLIATKQAAQSGEVQVRKTAHEHQEQVPVTLRHEEVTVERRPLQGQVTEADLAQGEQVIRVPVYEEQAQLQKQATAEEVVVHKQTVEQQQTLTGTVRHENVEVDQSGNVQVQGNVQGQTRQGQAGYNTQYTEADDTTNA